MFQCPILTILHWKRMALSSAPTPLALLGLLPSCSHPGNTMEAFARIEEVLQRVVSLSIEFTNIPQCLVHDT